MTSIFADQCRLINGIFIFHTSNRINTMNRLTSKMEYGDNSRTGLMGTHGIWHNRSAALHNPPEATTWRTELLPRKTEWHHHRLDHRAIRRTRRVYNGLSRTTKSNSNETVVTSEPFHTVLVPRGIGHAQKVASPWTEHCRKRAHTTEFAVGPECTSVEGVLE